MEENKAELAQLETLDNGKPISETINADIPLAIEHLRYYAGWTTKIVGQTIPVNGQFFNYTRHEPVGVVGQIIPWNFPLLWPCGKWGLLSPQDVQLSLNQRNKHHFQHYI